MQALVLSFVSLLCLVSAQNVTSSSNDYLPAGYSNHGKPDLLCHPAQWTDYINFYFGNYVIHAATLTGEPGQSLATWLLSMITALFFPTFGVCRALESILNLPLIRGRTDLQIAARAGALFQVVEDERILIQDLSKASEEAPSQSHVKPAFELSSSRPTSEHTESATERYVEWLEKLNTQMAQGDDHHDRFGTLHTIPSKYLWPKGYERITVHGCADLPPGFVLERVSADASFAGEDFSKSTWNTFSRLSLKKAWANVVQPSETKEPAIVCSRNTVSILVSILQLVFSAVTYYKSRGDQVDRYGFAAFGFTVVPYTLMTLFNLFGNLVCPSYDAVYLVETQCLQNLKEALRRKQMELRYPLNSRGTLVEDMPSIKTSAQLSTSRNSEKNRTNQYDRTKRDSRRVGMLVQNIGLWIGLLPLAVIGGISRFRKGSSTHAQRSWIMTWLVLGGVVGATAYQYLRRSARINEIRPVNGVMVTYSGLDTAPMGQQLALGAIVLYSAPAIGTFIVVGQMLNSYGICETLS